MKHTLLRGGPLLGCAPQVVNASATSRARGTRLLDGVATSYRLGLVPSTASDNGSWSCRTAGTFSPAAQSKVRL